MAELRENPISSTKKMLLIGSLFSLSSSMYLTTYPKQKFYLNLGVKNHFILNLYQLMLL